MATPKSIAIIGNQVDSLVRFRGRLVQDLSARGFVVYAFIPRPTAAQRARLQDLGATPRHIPIDRTGLNPMRDILTTVALRRELRRVKPDIVFSYSVKPVIFGGIAAFLAGVRNSYSLVTGLGYAFIKAEPGTRAVKKRFARTVITILYWTVFHFNRRVFFQNPDDLAQFVNDRLLSPHRAVLTNGTGIDLAHFPLSGPHVAPLTFTLIARMIHEKGVREFVSAAEHVREKAPGVRFLLVGGTDQNPAAILTADLQTWHDEGIVEWRGHVDDVRPTLTETSVFVLPSYREGVPRSAQEALSMGRAIITTDVPGCRETVIPGQNGFLVEVRSATAIADAMMRFVDDPDLVRTMGKASRRLAVRKFDVSKINRHLIDTLERTFVS